jgi:WD40 repeat protein
MDVPGPSSVIDALSQLSASATVDLSSVLDASTDNFEDDIPTVTELPTLDSILNEETDEAPTVDELGLRDVLDDESIIATPSFTDSNQSRDYLLEGSILRHSTLQGISNQLTRPNVRTNCGLPTALAAGVYRVIGTSRGVALIFDSKEQLKNILIPYQPGKKYDEQVYGAVSALDLLHDGTRLLIGHSKGLITHWDLENNKLLRFIDDAHPPGFAVLNLRVTHISPEIISSSNDSLLTIHQLFYSVIAAAMFSS